MYSSIEEEEQCEVIKKCYWPIFQLADAGIPIGLEAPALTLELINETDSTWVETLSKYINDGKIEFIGSGYSQIIGPLVPAKVNEWNQKLGLETYDRLLGVKPKIALVNEMAYSGGIVEHYVKAGYDGLIMEWNNPCAAHPEWENEWRYHPQKAKGADDKTIPVIWADSIAFQKFQRYSHDEYELDDYIQFIKTHLGDDDRYFPLYSNDVEIFDYRPGRYYTEAHISGDSEWSRIIDLYNHLNQQDWCEFVFPLDVLNGLKKPKAGFELQLESSAQPIPVKKQEKYNINRWALTGRDDLGINTKCYEIYDGLVSNDNEDPNDWRELCYLWSSDFRTHITKSRWVEYVVLLDNILNKRLSLTIKGGKEISQKRELVHISEENKWITVENDKYKLVLNKNKGLTIQKLVSKNISDKSLLGTLDHGFYDDISLGADYYSGHAIIERPGEHKVTDLGKVSPEIIDSDSGIELKTDQKWGNYTFYQIIQFNRENIVLKKRIEANSAGKTVVRPYNFTFNPNVWDNDSLFIETHNGGSNFEKFYLKGQNISHGDIYSSLISARHGFGNTEGILTVGDKVKSITFKCEMLASALIPSIIYKEMDGVYFFRLHYSGREIDETVKNRFKTKEINKIMITINKTNSKIIPWH